MRSHPGTAQLWKRWGNRNSAQADLIGLSISHRFVLQNPLGDRLADQVGESERLDLGLERLDA